MDIGRNCRLLVAPLALLAAHTAAHAQPAPQRGPGTALPGQRSPLLGIVPPPVPGVAPPAPPPPTAPAAVTPSATVAIADVTVIGSTAYTQASFAPLLAGLTGPAVPLSGIEAARTAIVNRYRNDGYPYVAVYAHVAARHLSFTVTEGRIVAVKLRGDIGPAATQVLRFLNHLTDIVPVSQAAIERWLLLANDIPGVSVRAVIDPSSTDPGALTLEAQLSIKHFNASIRTDNRAFRQTGPEELLVDLRGNSFTSLGEMTEVSLYHTYDDTETFGQASEEFFVGGSGLRVRLYGGAGESIPSGNLRAVDYDGVTRVFGASAAYPLIRSRAETLTLSAHFDGLESDVTEGGRRTFDGLRVLSGEAEYVRSDLFLPFLGGGRSASDIVDARVSQGLPTFGASSEGGPELPRLNERLDFTKGSLEIDRLQPLFVPYPGLLVSVLGAAAGQYTNNVLPPEEEYYLGGPTFSGPYFNPGYYYGQVTGDRALQAKIEPRLDVPLGEPAFLPVPLNAQFYGFYDWGETWQVQRLDAGQKLRSIGGGVRLQASSYAEIDVEGVSRLTRDFGAGVSRLKSSAVYWQLVLDY